MGSTTYRDLTAEQAKNLELSGCEVLAKSGNWYIYRTPSGFVGLVHFLVQRYADGVNVKAVDIDMGPTVTPPKRIAEKFLEYYDGDVEAAGGVYGGVVLRQALSEQNVRYDRGQKFVVKREGRWDDGAPLDGTYTFIAKFRAVRSDGVLVRLPRTWRRTWNHHPVI